MNAASSVPTRSPRLHSLDALRGLDMLIILGLARIFTGLCSQRVVLRERDTQKMRSATEFSL